MRKELGDKTEKACPHRFNCRCHRHRKKESGQVNKENLSKETLEEMRKMEVQFTEGYLCKKCDIRFDSSQKLIDHMVEGH